MKKVLLGSTAIVAAGLIAAPSAMAAERLSAKVGGYMEQWVGYVQQDDTGNVTDRDGFDIKSDSEIFFSGATMLDNGVEFGINVQLEGNTDGDQIDESYIFVNGAFGTVNIGSENSSMYTMHYAPSDFGIGLISGDQSAWVSADGVGGTTGTYRGGFGSTYLEPARANDAKRLTYYSPRFSGFQVGASYVPSTNEDNNSVVDRNSGLNDGYTVAANYKGDFGGASVGLSGGWGTIDNAAKGASDPTAYNLGLTVGFNGFGAGVSYGKSKHDLSAGDMKGMSAGVNYSTGPWGASLVWFKGDRDGVGGSALPATVTTYHLSGKYALGPGVTAAATLGHTKFEDDTVGNDGTNDNDGTYFVTGIKMSF